MRRTMAKPKMRGVLALVKLNVLIPWFPPPGEDDGEGDRVEGVGEDVANLIIIGFRKTIQDKIEYLDT
jgi:hypothetical protein